MSQLVSRSREKNKPVAPTTAKSEPKEPDPTPPKAPAPPSEPTTTTPTEPQKLTDLLGKALKFTPKPAQPVSTVAPSAPPVPAAPAAPASASTTEPAAPKKGNKIKKNQIVDPTAIVTAATTAATEAAVRAMQPAPSQQPEPSTSLSDDDRKDYEVAQHLARLDPRYSDAPKIILDHVNRAEDYAARWEAANPGKEFNASDDEHDDFFSTLQRPWTASDFNEAKIDLAAEKKLSKFKEEHQGTMQGLQADQARMEMAPSVDRKFNEATIDLAKSVGDDVHKILTTEGWDGLSKADPVTAQVMATTLDQMHPFIQAAIEIDDPRQRVRVDTKNPAHAQWNQVVSVGEARLAGQQLEDGRVFARRADFVRMTPAQQATHWYLTTDMIIEGALDYAKEQVKSVAKAQKERLEKMGFVRNPPTSGAPPTTQAQAAPTPTPAPSQVDKPVSPTVGSGAKIDDTGGAPKSKEAQLMQQISGILFRK